MKKLTILSLNCFDVSLFSFSLRKTRLRFLLDRIVTMRPDIVCLQEINFWDTARLFSRTLENAGYIVYPKSREMKLLNPSGLLTASIHPISQNKTQAFRNQGALKGWDLAERITRRGYHVVMVSPEMTHPIQIINTHFHCPFGAYESTRANPVIHSQFRQIVDSERVSHRCVLTGDLNTITRNELHRLMIKKFVDPLNGTATISISTANTNRKRLYPMNQRIDYTLLSPDIARGAIQKIILTKPVEIKKGLTWHLSDHFGVWTEVRLPEDRGLSKNE